MKIKFLILPLASLLFSACTVPFLSKTAEQVQDNVEQKAAEQEILTNCQYDNEICQYLVAQMRAYESGFTMTSDMTGKNPSQSVTFMDGQGNMSSTSTLDGKETSAMIVFNQATYIKDYDDNTWMKMTNDDTGEESSSPVDIPNSIDDIKESFDTDAITTTYTKLGQEPCGDMAPGLTCDIYEMADTDEASFTSKIWIDTKQHLSRKMEFALTDGGINTIVYTYDPVTITEPTPVKEFKLPDFSTGEGEIPSQDEINKMMEDIPREPPGI